MERWGFLFSAVSSPIVYFLTTTRAVCPNIHPIILCTHVCDVNYAACYCEIKLCTYNTVYAWFEVLKLFSAIFDHSVLGFSYAESYG